MKADLKQKVNGEVLFRAFDGTEVPMFPLWGYQIKFGQTQRVEGAMYVVDNGDLQQKIGAGVEIFQERRFLLWKFWFSVGRIVLEPLKLKAWHTAVDLRVEITRFGKGGRYFLRMNDDRRTWPNRDVFSFALAKMTHTFYDNIG